MLSIKYRPQTWDDIVSQRPVTVPLRRMVEQGTVTMPMVFEGPSGTGKTTLAKVLAKALNCEAENKPCLICDSCVAVGEDKSISVLELDAASHGSVSDIRKIHESLLFAGSGRKVLILDECHRLSKEAFDALLKILEEPPGNVVFVLVTTAPNKIPETVYTRCLSFAFRKAAVADTASYLSRIAAREGFESDDDIDLFLYIAKKSQGSIRSAVNQLNQVILAGITTVSELTELSGEIEFSVDLVKAMVSGDANKAFSVLDSVTGKVSDYTWITDQIVDVIKSVLVVHAGGQLEYGEEKNREIYALAKRLPAAKCLSGLRVVWESKTRLRPMESNEATVNVVVGLLTQAFSDTLKTVSLKEIEEIL